jgi:arylsulfatase A-like enzyme
MRLGSILRGAARGAVAGVVAGACWWIVETTLGWRAGSAIPADVLRTIAVLDVALGAVVGLIVGAAIGLTGREARGGALALALAAGYGLLRVYEPPGLWSEALFVAAAAAVAAVGLLLAGRDRNGALGFVHLTLLATVGVTIGEFVLEERGVALRGARLPLVFAAMPIAGIVLDAGLRLAVRRRAVRFGLELAVLAMAVVLWGHPLATAPIEDPIVTAVPPPAGTPDVILVVLDTTRADHLSTYGYGRDTSPNLSKLAEDGMLFTQARSPAAWTLPGHASLFTGMYPSRHGAHLAGAWLPGESIDGRPNVAFPLRPEADTMAEVLRDRGYTTGGFVANFSYLYRDWGVAQGFGHYDEAPGLLLRHTPHVVRFAQHFVPEFCLKPYRSARQINTEALGWLDRAPAGRPVFLFLNYMEPHQPWLAPAPYDRWSRGLPHADRLSKKNLYTHAVHAVAPEEREFITASYDGQLAAMDAALGELFDALRRRGRYENALVIVTADHGEFLGDHDQLGHIGRMLYEPVLHVPLVVKFPGAERPRGRETRPVQLVDVLPTVVATAGASLPDGVQGQPLLQVSRPSVAEEEINPFLVANYGEVYNRGVRVLYDGDYKLISTTQGQRMLFDLARDPGELDNLAEREPERTAALLQRLHETLDTRVGTPEAVVRLESRAK